MHACQGYPLLPVPAEEGSVYVDISIQNKLIFVITFPRLTCRNKGYAGSAVSNVERNNPL